MARSMRKSLTCFKAFHLKTMNELTGVDCKMEAENRNQFERSLLEEINEIRKNLGARV